MKLKNSRVLRQGSLATIFTVAVIVLVILINMVASALSQRYDLRADLTPGKAFGISQITQDFLAALDQDVTIYVLNSETNFTLGGDYLRQANEVLKKYGSYSDRIALEYVDISRNPAFVNRFPDLALSVNGIIIESGGRARSLSVYDLFNIETNDYGYSRVASSKAEQAVTSAIIAVTDNQTVTVALVTGYNEMDLDTFRAQLMLNNYEVVSANILTQDIPEEASIAIICAPLRDYSDESLARIEKFLENDGSLGKTVFYLGSVEQDRTPALDSFLADWGVMLEEGVVFETDIGYILNLDPYSPVVDYQEDEFAGNLINQRIFTAMPAARPIALTGTERNGVTVSVLLAFSWSAGVQPYDPPEDWEPLLDGTRIPALTLSTKVGYTEQGQVQSHVLICGSSYALDQAFLESTVIANSQYFIRVFNILSGREDQIVIESKALDSAQLGMSGMHVLVYGLVFVILVPLAVLIAGAIMFFRRRHL